MPLRPRGLGQFPQGLRRAERLDIEPAPAHLVEFWAEQVEGEHHQDPRVKLLLLTFGLVEQFAEAVGSELQQGLLIDHGGKHDANVNRLLDSAVASEGERQCLVFEFNSLQITVRNSVRNDQGAHDRFPLLYSWFGASSWGPIVEWRPRSAGITEKMEKSPIRGEGHNLRLRKNGKTRSDRSPLLSWWSSSSRSCRCWKVGAGSVRRGVI